MAPQNGSSEHVGNYFSDRYFVSIAIIFLALILKKGPFYLQEKNVSRTRGLIHIALIKKQNKKRTTKEKIAYH